MTAADVEDLAGLLALPRAFVDCLDRHDLASGAALMADDVLIIDDFAPHVWSGEGAYKRWSTGYAAKLARVQVWDERLEPGPPVCKRIEGASAYIVVPVTASWTHEGRPGCDRGVQTFVLRRERKAWKIVAWVWSGGARSP